MKLITIVRTDEFHLEAEMHLARRFCEGMENLKVGRVFFLDEEKLFGNYFMVEFEAAEREVDEKIRKMEEWCLDFIKIDKFDGKTPGPHISMQIGGADIIMAEMTDDYEVKVAKIRGLAIYCKESVPELESFNAMLVDYNTNDEHPLYFRIFAEDRNEATLKMKESLYKFIAEHKLSLVERNSY